MNKKVKLQNGLFNVDSLVLLERLPNNCVDLVYLDPPWPRYQENAEEYFYFLAQRLQHIHRVTIETGNLFVHMDSHYAGHVQLLVEQFFGVDNFLGQFIVPSIFRADYSNSRARLDYSVMLLFGKSSKAIYHPPQRPYTKEDIERSYPYKDEKGRYRLLSLIVPTERSAFQFEWNNFSPPPNRYWRYSREKLDQLHQDGLISFQLSKRIPSLKQYMLNEEVQVGSIWSDIIRPLGKAESTGYISQQSVDLLTRIIKIGSEDGDLILDPFCGAGTSLVAAHQNNRRWVGCDISPHAYNIALQRLNNFLESHLSKARRFQIGTDKDVSLIFPEVYKLEEPSPVKVLWSIKNDEPQLKTDPPLILTEGKTDWKHLKSAFLRLKEAEHFEYGFDLEFHEYENEMGDDKLLKMCENYSELLQPRKTIFIFDRDNEGLLKKIAGDSTKFKCWGNNVYSFAIPQPTNRLTLQKVSIEFYYREDDLKRKDADGRRLFLSNEFHSQSGRHICENLNCMDINKLKSEIKIIDAKVYDCHHQTVALSKDDFANNIIYRREGFDTVDIGI